MINIKIGQTVVMTEDLSSYGLDLYVGNLLTVTDIVINDVITVKSSTGYEYKLYDDEIRVLSPLELLARCAE